MSATSPASEYEALTHVIRRLAERFPAVDEDEVRALVVDELVSLDGAWIRDFVPTLVEGAVKRRLRFEGAQAA